MCWLELIIGGNCELSVTAHQQTIDHSNSLPPAQTMLRPRHQMISTLLMIRKLSISLCSDNDWTQSTECEQGCRFSRVHPHNIKHIHSHYIVMHSAPGWSESQSEVGELYCRETVFPQCYVSSASCLQSSSISTLILSERHYYNFHLKELEDNNEKLL